MKKSICLVIVFFACFIVSAQEKPIMISASDHAIVYTGRFDFSDSEKPVFMYSGCAVKAAFTGTSITMKLQDDSLKNWFTVKLDDSIYVFASNKKDRIYKLGNNLANKKHIIEISRRTEWHAGNTVFLGFEIDHGCKLLPLQKSSRIIEFIGDSYTCGYGNEGKSNEEHFKYETENNYLSYGAITARELNAAYTAVCRSGIGMLQAYGGDKSFVQPKLYDEVVAKSKAVWDYKSNQAAVVVIALGANDFSKPLDSVEFINTYVQFVQKIRNQYPLAKIICVSGPASPGEEAAKFHTHITAVTDRFKSTDKNVYFFEFIPFIPHGSDWHPNVKEHQQMAKELTAFIKKITSW